MDAGYAGRTVVKDITVEFPSGCVTSILGKNGCGKSTLLKTAARQMKPMGGQILLDGRDIYTIPPKEFARNASVLPQSREIPSISAHALVLHGRFPYLGFPRRPSPQDLEIVEKAMHDAGAWEYREKSLSQLSGGERQKVYLAMVLAQDTDVIFMDEPATYLDISHQFEILRLIEALRDSGKTIITVLHDLGQALSVSDQILLLENGSAAFFGGPEDLFASGKLDQVFGIRSHRILLDGTVEYVFRPQTCPGCSEKHGSRSSATEMSQPSDGTGERESLPVDGGRKTKK